ncbi:glycosyl hydrolase family 95 catalytic domain-containing protein [Nonomuraea sp. NPDC049480]|uniref:glycosyl hydrolase family 95 catalytic domain-containing protein n=1 Tax=Nonomuraea sp. NPDC049480 TaxID=3364353 RepID=UPI0037B1D173
MSRRAVLGTAAGGLALALAPTAAHASPEHARPWRLRERLSWPDFLKGQDLVWGRLPKAWHEGPFLGDGLLGSMVYQEPNQNKIRFTVQHGRVQDHRPQFGSGWGTCRLPVGHMTLDPAGTITAVDWRLSLYDAEVTGTITTDKGKLAFTAFIHDEILVVKAEASGEEQVRWTFHPEAAVSPRSATEAPPSGYTPNPPWTTATTDGIEQVVQPLTGGGQTATAHRVKDGTLLVAVAHSFPSADAQETALGMIRGARPYGIMRKRHRDWWHDFYGKSFVSLPDQRLQSFYWIQLYKVAAASRAGGPVMATTGPWLEPTPWPAVWWNLNVQLEYWLINGSNHLELDSLTSTLDLNRQQLINNVPAAYREDSAGVGRSSDMFATRGVGTPGSGAEVGDLTWALHNAWLSYRHTMDDKVLRDTVFPLLRRAINYYLHFLTPGADGRLHLPSTLSPEYPVTPPQDTNYDLALIRWGCRTLLDSAARLRIDDPLKAKWQEVLDKLAEYPVDADGFMIGANTPYAQSHRHYSHLLMVYPLYLVNWDQPEHRELIEKSVVHWQSLTSAHRGYSYTGACSLYAMMGKGDTALSYLERFFDPASRYPCRANTHYAEAGPVIETPLSAAQSIHDLLCQSWGGIVRVFPAVPAAWQDVTLHDFRTEGAFLVSAVRQGGRTGFIRVRSLAGEPLRIKHGLDGPLTAVLGSGRPARVKDLGGGIVEITLARGQEVLLYTGRRPDPVIAPVKIAKPGDPWGLPPVPPPGRTTPVDLSAHFDNDGVSTHEAMTDGNADGSGYTYPAEELPPAGPLTHEGLSFVFPAYGDGVKNNVTGQGQTVSVPPGAYAKVRLLGAGTSGSVSAALTATYADGSTAQVPFVLPDWGGQPGAGTTEVLRCTHRHGQNGANTLRVGLFETQAALDPAKELRSLTLPALTRPQLHLFALSLEGSR